MDMDNLLFILIMNILHITSFFFDSLKASNINHRKLIKDMKIQTFVYEKNKMTTKKKIDLEVNISK